MLRWLLFFGLAAVCPPLLHAQRIFTFPEAYRSETCDTLFGTAVHDPYRWLEQKSSPETTQWLGEQEKLRSRAFGITYYPLIKYLSLFSHIDYNPIFKEGREYFSFRVEDRYQTASLYMHQNPESEPRFLFNPNNLNRQDAITIDRLSLSENGKTLALVLSRNGSDWKYICFLDIASRHLYADTIRNVKYSPVYWHGEGLFYIRYTPDSEKDGTPSTTTGRSLFYHRLGTPQSEDLHVYSPENEYDYFTFEVTPGGRYLVLYHPFRNSGELFYTVSLVNLGESGNHFSATQMIITRNKDHYFNVLGETGENLLVQTNLNASRGAVYEYDPTRVNQGTIVLAQQEELLEHAELAGGKILAFYTDNDRYSAVVADFMGNRLSGWNIPEGYRVSSVSASADDSLALYTVQSFYQPPSIVLVNLSDFRRKTLSRSKTIVGAKDLITKKIMYPSVDSTLIPMFITHRRNIRLDGSNPVLLYGYGSFGVKLEPFFSVANMIFLNNGGVLAIPGVRGGGDLPGWHEEGMRLNKKNSFDDFISAAEYLILNKYTNPDRLAAMGGSSGGLLVAAAMLQRPDLFQVVVARSGLFDMLRYHLFNVGYLYAEEYGTVNDSSDFFNLHGYSPVHNVDNGTRYPATLLVASDNDDRVPPFHSFKLLAALQARKTSPVPYALYYIKNAGHSGSAIFENQIEMESYIYSFLYRHMGIERKIRYVDE